MKKVIYMLVAVLFFSLQTALAHAQYGAAVFGGPRTYINVINNTDRPVRLQVANAVAFVDPHGRMSSFKTSYFANGDVGVYATICKATDTNHGVNSAPTDENFPLGELSITDSFLESRPDMAELKQKVEAIEVNIKGQPGAGAYKDRLNAWLKDVKRDGLKGYHTTCDPEFTIAAKIPYQGFYYNGYGGDPLINIVIEQDSNGRRQLRSGQYIYGY